MKIHHLTHGGYSNVSTIGYYTTDALARAAIADHVLGGGTLMDPVDIEEIEVEGELPADESGRITAPVGWLPGEGDLVEAGLERAASLLALGRVHIGQFSALPPSARAEHLGRARSAVLAYRSAAEA